MTVTMLPIHRCKNCVFWQPYVGTIENKIMRRIHGTEQPPKTKVNACQLVLRGAPGASKEDTWANPDSKPIYPSLNVQPGDVTGPRFGDRVSPNYTCLHCKLKRRPYVTPGPTELKTMVASSDLSPPVAAPLDSEMETLAVALSLGAGSIS